MVRFKSPKTYFSQTVEFGHETPAIVFKMSFPSFLSINIDMFGATEIWVLGLAMDLSYMSSLGFIKPANLLIPPLLFIPKQKW